jgi:hypothetical protein
MALAIYLAQFKVFGTALGSLISSVQAFRASRSDRRLHLLVYLVGAAVLIYLTLIFLPDLANS